MAGTVYGIFEVAIGIKPGEVVAVWLVTSGLKQSLMISFHLTGTVKVFLQHK
jgi:hypothetical protein